MRGLASGLACAVLFLNVPVANAAPLPNEAATLCSQLDTAATESAIAGVIVDLVERAGPELASETAKTALDWYCPRQKQRFNATVRDMKRRGVQQVLQGPPQHQIGGSIV